MSDFADKIRLEAVRRAVEGVPDAQMNQGKVCFMSIDAEGRPVEDNDPKAVARIPVVKQKYSDGLMIAVLRAYCSGDFPEEGYFKDKAKDGGGTTVNVNNVAVAGATAQGGEKRLTPEEFKKLPVDEKIRYMRAMTGVGAEK